MATAIAFTSNRTADRDFNNHTDLWVVSVDGGRAAQADRDARPVGAARPGRPMAQTIAFLGHVNPEPYGRYANAAVWTVAADGSAHAAQPDRGVRPLVRGRRGGRPALRAGGAAARSGRPTGRALYATAIERGTEHLFRLDLARAASRRGSSAGQRGVMNARLSGDGAIVFTAATVTNPGDLYRCALDGSDEQRLTEVERRPLRGGGASDAERVHLRGRRRLGDRRLADAADRLEDRQAYPLVLEIHGGPHAQYGIAFFHEFQVLAAQGYDVLYTNPRGSTGYGERRSARQSLALGRGGLPRHDGRRRPALAAQPWIDPARLGVAGGSLRRLHDELDRRAHRPLQGGGHDALRLQLLLVLRHQRHRLHLPGDAVRDGAVGGPGEAAALLADHLRRTMSTRRC